MLYPLIPNLRLMTDTTKMRRLFPPQQCTYSTPDCSPHDECGCNQFSAPFEVKITRIGQYDIPEFLRRDYKYRHPQVAHYAKVLDVSYIEGPYRKEPNYTFAYVVLGLGALLIAFHYLVLPHIWAHFGIN